MDFSQRGLPPGSEKGTGGVSGVKKSNTAPAKSTFYVRIYTVHCIGYRPDFSRSRLKFYQIFLHEKYFRLVGKSHTFFSKPRLETNNCFLICRLQEKRGTKSNCKKDACPNFFSNERATKSKTLSFVLLFCANRLTFRFHVSFWKSFLKILGPTVTRFVLAPTSFLPWRWKPFFFSSLPLSPFCQPISFPTQKKREGEYRIPPSREKKRVNPLIILPPFLPKAHPPPSSHTHFSPIARSRPTHHLVNLLQALSFEADFTDNH